MPTCYLKLRPLIWKQSVEHYTGINVEDGGFPPTASSSGGRTCG
jgi:hypothetical protein